MVNTVNNLYYTNLYSGRSKFASMSAQMLQNYQSCIKSLQNQISSRQNQRKKMEQSINNYTKILNKEQQQKKELKQLNAVLMKDNQQIFKELQYKEKALSQQNQIIQQYEGINAKNKQKISILQIQKSTVNAQLKAMKEGSVNKNTELTNLISKNKQFENQIKRNLSLIEGYKNLLSEKSVQLSRVNNHVSKLQDQLKAQQSINADLRTKYESSLKAIQQYRQSSTNKELNLGKSNQAIEQMKQEMFNLKVFHQNQIKTLSFNHQAQRKQFQMVKIQLGKDISQLEQKVVQLQMNNKSEKNSLQKNCSDKQQVIQQLIEQINFLKGETIQLKKRQSLKEQQITGNILKMSLQLSALKDQALNAQQQVKRLQKELLDQKEQYRKYKEIQAQIIAQKNFQIQTLKQNIIRLQKKQEQLQKQSEEFKSIIKELNEDKMRMTFQFNQHSHSKQQSQKILQTQGESMKRLSQLLTQSKKINQEFSSLLSIKIKQIETLQENNHLLRRQKIQYLNNQQQYRKKIIYLKNSQVNAGKNFRESNVSNSVKSFLKGARTSKQLSDSSFHFRENGFSEIKHKESFTTNRQKPKINSNQEIELGLSKELFSSTRQGAISQRKQIIQEQDHSLQSPPKLQIDLSLPSGNSSQSRQKKSSNISGASGKELNNLILDINQMV